MQNGSIRDHEKLLKSKFENISTPSISKERIKILIVDDERSILKILKDLLNRKGYSVMTAINGKEAMKNFISAHFDLVITDLNMPHMDGRTLAGKIKEKANIPVILLTGDKHTSGNRTQKEPNIDYILFKPFNFLEIENAIQLMLAKSKTGRSIS